MKWTFKTYDIYYSNKEKKIIQYTQKDTKMSVSMNKSDTVETRNEEKEYVDHYGNISKPTKSSESTGADTTESIELMKSNHPDNLYSDDLDATKLIVPNSDIGANEAILMQDLELNMVLTQPSITAQQSRSSYFSSRSNRQSENNNDSNSNDKNNETELPFDRGYSWVILIVGTAINAFSWGASGSYGVFLANFLSSHKYPDATRIDFAFVGGLQFGLGLAVSPVVTYVLQFWPYSLVVTAGAILEAAAYIAASFATKKWHLYLSQGLLSGISIGIVFVPANSLMPQWFLKKRGIANGFFTSGAGLGSIIFNLSVQSLIEKLGMAWAQRFVGIVCCAMLCICAIFVKERRSLFKHKRTKVVNLQLLSRLDIWMAIIWGTLTMMCYGIVLYTLAPYAVSVGLTHEQASILSSILSVGIIVGRPLLGHLADVIGSINAALVSTFFSTIFILAWWIPSKSYPSLIVFSLFLGGVVSSFSVGFPPICASIVKFDELSSMIAMSWTIIGTCNIFSTPIAIGLTKIDGSYLYSQIFTGSVFFLSGVILLITRGVHRRNTEMKKVEDGRSHESSGGNNDNEQKQSQIEVLQKRPRKPLFYFCFQVAKV